MMMRITIIRGTVGKRRFEARPRAIIRRNLTEKKEKECARRQLTTGKAASSDGKSMVSVRSSLDHTILIWYQNPQKSFFHHLPVAEIEYQNLPQSPKKHQHPPKPPQLTVRRQFRHLQFHIKRVAVRLMHGKENSEETNIPRTKNNTKPTILPQAEANLVIYHVTRNRTLTIHAITTQQTTANNRNRKVS